MEKENMQSVLRCGQCNKPFDKQSTLKRHGYYCRSRKSGGGTRYRSCASCARGKARCDNKRPECTRCFNKGIQCHYPSNAAKDSKPSPQNSEQVQTTLTKTGSPSVLEFPLIAIHQDAGASINGNMALDDTLVIPDLGFNHMGAAENLSWDYSNLDFSSLLNVQPNDEMAQYTPWGTGLASPQPDPAFQLQPTASLKPLIPKMPWHTSNNQIFRPNQLSSAPKSMIPTMPTSSIRSMIVRPWMEPGKQKIATLILHTLKSYPLMMSRHKILPPFIHPSLVDPNIENADMELLATCLNLVHMTGSKVQGSRKLFWKNVKMECEFMLAEYTRLNPWQLLAALQALSLYTLIRLSEGETDHNNFDMLLVRATIAISMQFNDRTTCRYCSLHSSLCNCNLDSSWTDWVLEESGRRMCIVYQVLNMLMYFEPASMCEKPGSAILLAPLPARKRLWEAGDAYAWKAEHERESAGEFGEFGLAADGRLVRLDAERVYYGSAGGGDDGAVVAAGKKRVGGGGGGGENWEEWCAGMDGFGGLVMLAASMIS